MIRAYLDDSSDPRRERYYICGGGFGVDSVWNRAEAAWISKTRHLAEPFRSTDCECQHGQFSKWEKSQRDQLMADLVSVLLDFDLSVYAGIVPIQHFRDVFGDAEEHDLFYWRLRQ